MGTLKFTERKVSIDSLKAVIRKAKGEKMKEKKPYKLKLKRGRIFSFLKSIFRIFKKKPEIINLSGEELKSKAIYLTNHAGANGPLTYELYFPKRITPWGAYEMTGNYKERWNYLYHVFYQQKLHWGKVKSFVIATLFAIISKMCYNAVGLIPTYTDNRMIYSIKTSFKILDANSSLLIFPEDSREGYFNPPHAFNKGFVAMSKIYNRIRKIDVPVYICSFIAKAKKIVVSKPIFVNKMLEGGMSEQEVVNETLQINHNLYNEYASSKTL